jgi:hypothetical protein
LSKFLIAHIEGNPILSDASAKEMQSLHVRQGTSETGMGLGFRVTRSNGRKLICHGGDGGGFTAFIGAHPEERMGVVLLINTGGMQVARSVIANNALAALAEPNRQSFAGGAPAPTGLYESTYWDTVVEGRDGDSPSLTVIDGLVLAGGPAASSLRPIDGSTFVGEGGMFHGFDVPVDGDRFYGGVYPFTFIRRSGLLEPTEVDEAADLTGAWTGTTRTPMGPLATTIRIASESEATIDTPFKQGVALADCVAAAGRLSGEFSLDVPGVGSTQMFVRLEARGGRLTGRTHARSVLGETPLITELERA